MGQGLATQLSSLLLLPVLSDGVVPGHHRTSLTLSSLKSRKYCLYFTSEKVRNRLLRRLAFVPDYIVNEQEIDTPAWPLTPKALVST